MMFAGKRKLTRHIHTNNTASLYMYAAYTHAQQKPNSAVRMAGSHGL